MSLTSDKQSKHTKLVAGGAIAVPLALGAVISAAANLRAGISSLGAVLEQVMASFQAPASVAGVLTAMPGFAFAIMGLAAVPIARRFGLSFTLFAGMVAMLVGLAFRPLIGAYLPGGMGTFIVLTALVVGGIALLNVLLPAWIKQHAPRRSVVLMSCYSGFLGLSGAVAPLSALWFSGEDAWRPALGIWALLAAVQVVVWILVLIRVGVDKPAKPPVAQPTNSGTESIPTTTTTDTAVDADPAAVANKIASTSLWRSPTAVAMMVLFGLQSSNAYVQMGWLPQMYIDQGVSPGRAAVGLAVLGTVNVIGGVSMPFVVARIRDLRPVIVVFGVLTTVGYLGVMFAGAVAPEAWAIVLGLGGMCFPTILALLAARTRTPEVTARLSGFVQPYGYLLAGVLPLLIGFVYQATGAWTLILTVMALTGVGMSALGYRAGKKVFIDDELAR
ncbi:MFS transporter [Corynebacterium propinquum]|uniref:MFS transporter n=1 Tax=Corynebacterium propinquum TaxID=43769 RepID=UPI00266EC2D9|nr:MFS transporter [Corynebacterium propinquum]WKS31216.1 MFS transporter [Corynebacterium propinquum]WKS35627.1 MFS transporter [Corynebacterium propinquum]WKS37612.1 MFS transporter [Corynebacterium propinquum]WKS43805.1 MFS transporter [Corynebacterium propinquum]WKS48014.1 MFS transporter [Corynebacterium propinquum]